MPKNPPKRVLIIGNGFDLDLGLKTGFSDFIISKDWPSPSENSLEGDWDLLSFLDSRRNGESWFDLENQLSDFAKLPKAVGIRSYIRRSVETNIGHYETLRKALMTFLNKEVESFEADKDSVAAFFLNHRMDALFSSVYSFNYTNYPTLYSRVSGKKFKPLLIPSYFRFSEDSSFVHIHGSLPGESAIIGIADGIDTVEGYSFLYKTFSPFYHSCSLWYDLQEAREVIFYGHSLGPQDYHYFQDFFSSCCQVYTSKREEKRRIVFITKDESCRVKLLEQIRQMNDKKSDLFFLLNEVHFVYTTQKEQSKNLLLNLHTSWYRAIMGREYDNSQI